VDRLVQLLERLDQDRDLLREAGGRARRAFEKYYDKPIGVASILSILGIAGTVQPGYAPDVADSTV
jgi:hypothetical protein